MIGICGFLALDGCPASPDGLAGMQGALVRCGTASFASHVDGTLAMGAASWHASLASTAAPALATHAATGCSVVADARLQGRDALRRALGLSAAETGTDAALILQAWLHWGERCTEHLDGDFAFVLHDPRQHRLFCARDAMGVRPLYLHHAPGRLFAFASSAPALLALPGVPRELDEARIADFLVIQLEGVDKTSTFFRHIERLPPAHQRLLEDGRSREHRYWRLAGGPLPGMPRTTPDWEAALAETLHAVVADHLAEDPATGCMLSGGMDSSSLALLAADLRRATGQAPLATFSSIDSRGGNPETQAIQAMLALPGFAPHCVDHAASGAFAERLWQRMWASEEPFDGIMTVLNAQYSSAADAGIRALMDGVDGDSLFLAGNGQARLLRGGHMVSAWRNARAQPDLLGLDIPAWRLFAGAARTALVPDAWRRWRQRHRRQAPPRLPEDALVSRELAMRVDLPARLERLDGWSAATPHWNRHADARESLEHPYITVGVERYRRVAAAYGIDPRHPFTDRRLMTLCSQLPDTLRMGDGYSKHLLRRVMRGRLPEPVRRRRDKQHLGWAQTQALLESHRGALAERMAAYRASLAPYVDRECHAALESVLATTAATPTPTDWQAIFNLVQLGGWLDRHSTTPVTAQICTPSQNPDNRQRSTSLQA